MLLGQCDQKKCPNVCKKKLVVQKERAVINVRRKKIWKAWLVAKVQKLVAIVMQLAKVHVAQIKQLPKPKPKPKKKP